MAEFQKSNAGRPKGAKGRTSKQARELYLKIIEGESEYITDAFRELREEDAFKYLSVLNKFTSYIIPKMVSSNEIIEYKHKPFDIREIFSVSDD